MYNLTVHSSIDKAVNCCIWNDTDSGRGGNTTASALLKALQKFVDAHAEITHDSPLIRFLCASEQELTHVICPHVVP